MKKDYYQQFFKVVARFSIYSFLGFLVTVNIVFASNSNAQYKSVKEVYLKVGFEDVSLYEVFSEIESVTNYRFTFHENDKFLEERITLKKQKMSVESLLLRISEEKKLRFQQVNNNIGVRKLESRDNDRLQINIEQQTITGTITDENGEPLPGATILEKGTDNGTMSDIDGKFTLEVAEGATLRISFVGFSTEEVLASQNLQISLSPDMASLDEVVVVGYGEQKKVTLTGAVSAVKGEDIVTTKNENAQNMLTGKISGVRVTQNTAEPGSFDNNFDIRAMGTPLIIIDGIPRTNEDLQRLDPNDIENLSVLKDASAAIYGVRAANGVVLVTTKKGTNNKIELNYSGSYTWQIPSGLPATVDAIEYMTLRNERAMHNVNGGAPIFNEEQFDAYRNGEKQSTDWYPLTFSNYAPQTIHNLNAVGGNEGTTYYISLGYQYQEGFFKSSDLNYKKYNIRSNITTDITDRLTLDINVNLIEDQQDRPWVDSWWIIRGFWRQGAHIPAYANGDPTKPYHGLIEGDNPISFMDKDIVGFKQFNKKWAQPSASLTYEIPGVEGLFLKSLISYNYYVSNNNLFHKEYIQYRYDETSETYTEFTRQSPNRVRRENYVNTQILGRTSLNYSGTFNNHTVGALLLGEVQKRKSDNFYAQRDLILQLPFLFAGVADQQLASMNSGADALYEDANLAVAGRVNYSYSDKYLAEFLFRYDGSSKFASGYQWGFFPAVSVGWRISEEQFLDNASFLSHLKLRASYGQTGDDGASSYQFISGYNYPTRSSRRNFTGGYVFDGSFYASADNKGVPNPFITWYTAKTFDMGIEFEAWNGLLGITADYFDRIRSGLLATRSGGIPTAVGAALPQENLNSDRTYGIDLEVSHRNHFRDFHYNLKGLFSLARVQRLEWQHAPYGSSWNKWRDNTNSPDRLQGIHWGLEGAGQFQSWEEIWSSPTYIGRGTLPGDYKYEDWNGDGEINGNDVHPTRYNQYPWMNFSMIFDASYKNFDLNFLLQGSALNSLIYGEQLREPMWGSGESGAMEQFMDRWHPIDPNADPYDPSTEWAEGNYAYTGTLPDANSTFNTENGAYLRLKSVELGYTLPERWSSKAGIENLRFYVNAYNLLTFTKVKYVDPEHPDRTWGYLYPLNKTVSTGINIKF